MIIPLNLMTMILCIVGIAVDITMFFLLVHLIQISRPVNWLAPIEKTGLPLVEQIAATVDNLVSSRLGRQLSERGRLAVCFGILTLIKLLLTGFLQICLSAN